MSHKSILGLCDIFAYTMNVITGAGVCLSIVIIGLSMIYHSGKLNKEAAKKKPSHAL